MLNTSLREWARSATDTRPSPGHAVMRKMRSYVCESQMSHHSSEISCQTIQISWRHALSFKMRVVSEREDWALMVGSLVMGQC